MSMNLFNKVAKAVGLALGIAVAALVLALVVGAYAEAKRSPWMPSARWIGFAVYTIGVFGVLIHEFRHSWKRSSLVLGSINR
jgi:hypothetical protein